MRKQFGGEIVCFELRKSVKYREKKSYIDFVIKNGGQVSFILNRKVNYLFKDDENDLDTYKCRQALKAGIRIVHVNYLNELIQSSDQQPIKIDNFLIGLFDNKSKIFTNGRISSKPKSNDASFGKKRRTMATIDLDKVKFYAANDSNDPFGKHFSDEASSYDVIKWIVVYENKIGATTIEIQMLNRSTDHESAEIMKYRLRIEKVDSIRSKSNLEIKCSYSNSGRYIFALYKEYLRRFLLNEKIYQLNRELPYATAGSKILQSVRKMIFLSKFLVKSAITLLVS